MERRAGRCGKRVGVGTGGRREPAETGGRSAAEAGSEGGTAVVDGGSAAVHRGTCTRPCTSASPPRDPNVHAMLRSISPPRIFDDHPSSQEMVSTAWAPHFHGSLNSSFLFNPVMAMQQMLPHPTRFTHNDNPAWLPQVDMTSGSDVRSAAEFTGGRFLAPDRASSAPQRHGMSTW